MEYPEDFIERFWAKVEVGKKKDCWPWVGAKRKNGYGHIKYGRKTLSAHRVAWELDRGSELGDRLALHKCDNPTCCNPSHIRAGSASRNMRDIHERSARESDKLFPNDIRAIRKALEDGDKPHWLADEYGVSKGHILKIQRGDVWAYIK